MASFAELDDQNRVIRVIVISNEIAHDNSPSSEAAGIDFILNVLNLGGVWKQTSYNTYIEHDPSSPDFGQSKHANGGTPFRGKFAGIGDLYDASNDRFVSSENNGLA